jgi:hypothetical protein
MTIDQLANNIMYFLSRLTKLNTKIRNIFYDKKISLINLPNCEQNFNILFLREIRSLTNSPRIVKAAVLIRKLYSQKNSNLLIFWKSDTTGWQFPQVS